jgi:hypothetical protein
MKVTGCERAVRTASAKHRLIVRGLLYEPR